MATTRAEALASAFDSMEQGTLAAPPEVVIEADTPEPIIEADTRTAAERARDEQGRFAKVEKPPQAPEAAPVLQAPAAPVAAAPVVPAQVEQQLRKPPSSWSKDQWERWNKLDPATQDYIDKRESDFAKGVSTYKAQWDQAAPLLQAMQPFHADLQQAGIPPQQWITNLGNAHRTLALGSPDQKLQMFVKLATDYGVPLQALLPQQGPDGQPMRPQVDPQTAHLLQTVSALQNRLQSFETITQQQEQTRLQNEIKQFQASVDPDTFEAAKPIMAQLLQSGMAPDLKTAFEKAIRVDDTLWQRQQAAEQARQAETAKQAQAEAERQRLAVIAQKKAAASSPKSSSPTGNTAAGGGKQDRRATLSEAFDNATAGRF
jgi:hypothetical protein